MESEVKFCANAGEYRVYFNICDRLCIESYYKNHLKSGTRTKNIYKRQRLNKIINSLFSLK